MNGKKFESFGERLSFLLDLRGIQQQELADVLNVSFVTVSNYVRNTRTPNLDIINKIADYFNVSADFLLGRSDDYRSVLRKNIDGKEIEITLEDGTNLSKDQIEMIFEKLKNVGWDIKKLL